MNDEINPERIITELVWLPAAGGAATLIAPLTNAGVRTSARDTTRVWRLRRRGRPRVDALGRHRPQGAPHRDRASSSRAQGRTRARGARRSCISPDGDRVLAEVDNKVYRRAAPGGRRADADGVGRAAEQRRHPVPPALAHRRRLPRLEDRREGRCTTRWGERSSRTTSRAPTRCARGLRRQGAGASGAARLGALTPTAPAAAKPVVRAGAHGRRDHGAEGPADAAPSCCAARASSR